jgi:antitoxin component of MazEF toxin-antitoxin module
MAQEQSRTTVVQPLRDGQLTIPTRFLEELGVDNDDQVELTLAPGELRIRALHGREAEAGSPWLKELYDLFAPVRREAEQYSEDEINAAVDDALRAVRRSDA